MRGKNGVFPCEIRKKKNRKRRRLRRWCRAAQIKASELLPVFRIDVESGAVCVEAGPVTYVKMMLDRDAVPENNKAAHAAFADCAYNAVIYYRNHNNA